MLTKTYPSLFMVVRVKFPGRRGIVVPVPLMVFEQLLDAVQDLVWVVEQVLPAKYQKFLPNGLSLSLPVEVCMDLLKQIRKYGKWKLAEVDTDRVRVEINFF